MSMVQGADKIRYEDVPKRLAPFESVLAYRGFNVVTLDGKRHSGRRLRLEADHVRVFHRNNSWEDLPSVEISRIEISQAGRFFHHIVIGAEIPLVGAVLACGGLSMGPADISPRCIFPVIALLSPVWAYTAVTTPFYLAADGVAYLIRPKTYEVVH